MKLSRYLLGLVMLLASAVQADSITTIQLMNRPAAEVIPIVRPMLATGDVITGKGFKIFLRSSPETLAEVKEMIDMLDTAAKILRVSVFQGSDQDFRTLNFSGNIQIEGDDASVDIGSDRNKINDDGGSISYSNGSASGDINASSTRLRLENNPIHQLRVTEGTQGYIETGEQIPYFSGVGSIRPKAVTGSVEYRAVTTGFYVLPRIHGDNVSLQISPFRNTPSKTRSGNIDILQANATITGPIGEWLLIGGATEQITRSQNGIASYSSAQGKSNQNIWIKADLVR